MDASHVGPWCVGERLAVDYMSCLAAQFPSPCSVSMTFYTFALLTDVCILVVKLFPHNLQYNPVSLQKIKQGVGHLQSTAFASSARQKCNCGSNYFAERTMNLVSYKSLSEQK